MLLASILIFADEACQPAENAALFGLLQGGCAPEITAEIGGGALPVNAMARGFKPSRPR
jgi:hypothetical protein